MRYDTWKIRVVYAMASDLCWFRVAYIEQNSEFHRTYHGDSHEDTLSLPALITTDHRSAIPASFLSSRRLRLYEVKR